MSLIDIELSGYCCCCCEQVVFRTQEQWFRDTLLCSNCSSIPRERALGLVLNQVYPDWRNLHIHECSPAVRGISELLQKECASYLPTQFFGSEGLGSIIEGVRNENLEGQTFADESFDIVVTQDVFEHLFDPRSAFEEISRTLKPGGAHIFTVPIINRHDPTEVWATLAENGEVQFIGQPEYHGNPIDPKGSPVTMHWGFDMMDAIKSWTGMHTRCFDIEDVNYGIWGRFSEVFVSYKG